MAATVPSRLYRSRSQKMLGGVCGGLGEYFDVDPILIRLLFVVTTFISGAGILAYIILWIVVPFEGDESPRMDTLKRDFDDISVRVREYMDPPRPGAAGGPGSAANAGSPSTPRPDAGPDVTGYHGFTSPPGGAPAASSSDSGTSGKDAPMGSDTRPDTATARIPTADNPFPESTPAADAAHGAPRSGPVTADAPESETTEETPLTIDPPMGPPPGPGPFTPPSSGPHTSGPYGSGSRAGDPFTAGPAWADGERRSEAPTAPPTDRKRRRQHWAGAILILLGLLILGNNLGLLWWIEAEYLLPLLLVGAGAWLLFGRGRRG